ncbi:up-regulator of cell proliferation-like [Platysternon megacephalum]|uniref:Up-regulator of cell proliferation-like n=1 Tax=Platysternon megacephalum TaxID=55544 RepID=A0A4D9DSC0_9SAUR|nr:up-regulator of cell proliferation-like [Platysternon megacephalum]
MTAENQDVLLEVEEEEEEEEDGEVVLEELAQTIVPSYGTAPDQQKLHTSEWVKEPLEIFQSKVLLNARVSELGAYVVIISSASNASGSV